MEPGWRGARRLLQGPLRVLVGGQALGQASDGLAQIAFAQLVVFEIGRGATPARIAGVLAATLLPFTVVGPFAGVLIDRWDRRALLVVASLVRVGLALAAAAVAVVRSEPLAYAGVLLLLSSSRFVLAGKGAVLPLTVAPTALVTANAVSGVIGMVSAFLGAVIGSLFVTASAPAAFVVAAVGYSGAAAAFLRLPPVGGGVAAAGLASGARRVLAELADGVGAIVRQAEIRRPLLSVWAHRLLLGAGFVLLVLVGDRQYHLAASGYGLALTATGIAAFAGAVVAPWLARRWRSQALLPLAFLPPALAALVCGYAPSLPGLLVALAVSALSFQVVKVLTDALVGGATSDAVRGRVFAVYDVLYNVAFVLAGLAMVPLWQPGRERALLWGLAAAFTAGWLVLARSQRMWPFSAHHVSLPAAAGRWKYRWMALAAGALPVLAFPAPALWWLAWCGLVPWLLLLRRAATAREAAIRGWFAAVGFLAAMHHWLLPNTGVLLVPAVAVLAALWLPWSAAVWWLLSGRLTARRLAAALLVLPAGWVVIEAVRSWSSLGGPWGLLGASQSNMPILLAPASLGGVWLVSYLVVAANTAVAGTIEAQPARLRCLAAASVLPVAAAGPASVLAEASTGTGPDLRVALVQPGVVHGPAQRFDTGERLTHTLPADQFGLVVWGESSVGFDVARRPDLTSRLAAMSDRLNSDLLVNVDARDASGAIHKTSVLVGPEGVKDRYEKMRLVPFGEYVPFRRVLGWLALVTEAAAEDRSRGRGVVVMQTNGLAFSPLVCFESAFPDMSRRVARQGADILVFQSSTSTFQDSWAPDQHASLAAVRAVETGRPAIHATLTGASAVFDAHGKRLAWFDTGYRGAVAVTVPLATRTTPYLRYGEWVLAWSFTLIVGAVITATLTTPGSRADRNPEAANQHQEAGRPA